MRWFGSLLVLAVALLLEFDLGHSQQLALVEAHFMDSDGAPLANQTLVVEGKQEVPRWVGLPWPKTERTIKVVATTDASGYVQLVDLPAGFYKVNAVKPGSTPVQVKTFTLGDKYKKFFFTKQLTMKEELQLKQMKEELRLEVWPPPNRPETLPSPLPGGPRVNPIPSR